MNEDTTPAKAKGARVGGGGQEPRGSSGTVEPETRAAVFLRPELRPRILLADDEPAVRTLVASVLRTEGYEVVEASDGAELVELVEAAFWARKRHRVGVSLVLTDVRMPEFSGIDVLWILRATSWEVPVILMGSWEDDPARIEAGELGANAFLRKPLDLEALRRVVRATLRGAFPARPGSTI